jgi:membrane protease subunit (stomatin/prohibitin family)
VGIFDFVKRELVDIIEWLDASGDTMVHRFERHDNEIKNGAKLIVRPGQTAVFVDEGRIADVFVPGTYTLTTENLPVLSTLRGWKYGFQSPFKAEVYFVATRQFTDRKWGTKNPIMLRDPEFGPVRLRAFGTYAVRTSEPAKLITEIVGTNGHFAVGDISDQLRNLITSRFADILGESRIPVLDLAASYDELGDFIAQKIRPEFLEYGLEITKVLVENISLPEEVERALDKRTSMGVIGNLQAYAQYQGAQAMEAAAKNPGGGAAEGMGLGMGFAMAQQMAQTLGGAQSGGAQAGAAQGGAAPPPLPQAPQFYIALGGEQSGPHTIEALRGRVADGTLTRETLAWRQGMGQWSPAGEVPELADLFAGSPPPLPG